MHILVVLIFFLLTGCYRSSGVLKLGPDSYTTSAFAHIFVGGAPEAQRMALTEANEYCGALNKEVLVTNMRNQGFMIEVTFRCIAKADHIPVEK